MTKIPFNIKYRTQIESGEYKVVTREDRPVEIKLWDLKGDFPVVGVYYDDKNNRDTAIQVTAEGKCSINPADDYCDDFFIIPANSNLTEFENVLANIYEKFACMHDIFNREELESFAKCDAPELLDIARKQMMKCTVDTEVKYDTFGHLIVRVDDMGMKSGDKIKINIIKEK